MGKLQYYLVQPLTYTGTESKGFTYELDANLTVGQIVRVPLGPRQSLGVVVDCVSQPAFATKPIAAALSLTPLPDHLVDLADWLGTYYFSSPKAVWQTLLPTGITKKRRATKKLESKFSLAKQNQPLNDEQKAALETIETGSKTTYLVQGVTGSGKTRLYLELAFQQMRKGKSAIILIPEISLTPQLLALFEASFPNRVVPYHSGLTEAAKHQAWQRVLDSHEPLIVVGPRSALFLPLAAIGLIVIDECHETSYKQEQNPRYQAIPVAAKLAALTGSKLVLGSATPALTEVYLAKAGKIELTRLKKRVEERPLPTTQVIDLRTKELLHSSKFISEPLLQNLKQTLANNRQSLLFLNRRGSASSQMCGDCGNVTLCPNCSLPLTFHADHLKLICHLCNRRQTPTAVCPSCGSTNLRFIGSGTKRIETEISRLLPTARLARLDKDNADPKLLPQLYQDLHDGKIDILIGTQMVAKGLDLPRLDTVGVINADTVLHMADFTSSERTFQLITQVSGRAGRGDMAGRVFIQTRTPDHPAIVAAAQHDFWTFAEAEMAQRRLLGYPPYRYLLKLTYGHKDQNKTVSEAGRLYGKLKENQGIIALGPAPAFHERIGGAFYWQIIVKSPKRSTLIAIAKTAPNNWKTDLDPINLL